MPVGKGICKVEKNVFIIIILYLGRPERGWDTALLHKKSVNVTPQDIELFTSFKHSEFLPNSNWIRITVVYPSQQNGFTVDMF